MRGYEPHDVTSPKLALDGVTWLPMRDIPMGDPKYFEWVAAVAAERKRLAPWTLVGIRGGEAPLIAVKRTLWWRLVTWWLNIGRRRERARLAAAEAERLAKLGALMAAKKSLPE